jgi:hypothetical protein
MDDYTKIIRLSPTKQQFQAAACFGVKNTDNFYDSPNDNIIYRLTVLKGRRINSG